MSARERLSGLAVSETGFVFDPVTGHTYTLSCTGLLALRLLQQGRSMAEIRDALLQRYDVQRDVLDRDIDEFLTDLLSLDLLSGADL